MKRSQPFQLKTLTAAMVNASILLLPTLGHAQNVTPAGGNTKVYVAPNGVPVVDIATANRAGLSHNKYHQFNVGAKGLVLNNGDPSKLVRESQLAGSVAANLNLSRPASVILNEVVSANRSTLAGYMEVVGNRADVIVANPYGITCNGCGFINTPRVTLTTGTPNLDPATQGLTGFRVNSGDVLINGLGLDARNITYLDIVARSIKVDGQINAQTLNLIAGANTWNYLNQSATAIAGDGAAPLFAIDSTLLGGMYANRIRLLATEAGVGVRMLGEAAATADDMTITASGQIAIQSKLSAERNISIVHNGPASNGAGAINISGAATSLSAKNNLVLSNLTSGAGITLSDAVLDAGNNLIVSSTGTLTDHVTTGNSAAGRYGAGSTTLTIDEVASIDNATWGSGGALSGTFGALAVANGGATFYAGADLALTATSGDLGLNGASVKALNAVTLTAQQGSIVVAASADGGVQAGAVNLLAHTQIQNAGRIVAANNLSVSSMNATGNLVVNNAGLMQAGNTLSVEGYPTGAARNQAVDVSNAATGQMLAGNALNVSGHSIVNSGTLQAANGATINAATLTNQSSGEILTSTTGTGVGTIALSGALTNPGAIHGNGAVTISAAGINNSGGISSLDNLALTATSDGIDNTGAFYTPKQLNITALGQTFTNQADGVVYAGAPGTAGAAGLGDIVVNVGTFRNYNEVIATHDVDITATAGFFNLPKGGVVPTVLNGGIIEDGTPTKVPGSVDDFVRRVGTCDGGIADYECNWYYTWTETDTVNQRLAPGWDMPIPAKIIAANDVKIAYGGGAAQNIASVISGNHAVSITTLSGASVFTNQDLHLNEITYLRRWHNWTHCNVCTSDDNYWMYPTNQTGYFTITDYRNQTSGPGVKETSSYEAARNAPDIYLFPVGSTPLGPNAAVSAGIYSQGQISFNTNTSTLRNAGSTGNTTSTISAPVPGGAGTFHGPDLTLPTNPNGFFVPTKDAKAKYLIETNPKYNINSGFLGSDYLVQRFGYDPERIQIRLGDANYEAKIVRDQLVAQTGRNIIAGYDSEAAQLKGLMDSAYTQSAELGLKFGVPLTQEQAGNLKQDIVWMEEQRVGSQIVLVPRVYLAKATRDSVLRGAVIAAADINIAGLGLQNIGGTIKADNNLDVKTTGDITNRSGTLSGGNVTITSTAGSIRNETEVSTGGDNTSARTIIGKTATIESTGDLTLDAKGNIVVKGGDVNAGGDATLKAGRNIVLDTIQNTTATSSASSSTSNAGLTSSSSSTNIVTTTQIGSNLNVGGNLATRSGNDTTMAGSNVKIGGNADIDAKGNLSIIAREDTTTTTTTTSEGGFAKAGGILGSTATTTTDRTTTNRGSAIVSGGDAKLTSGSTLTVQGSDVAADRDLTVKATDIRLLAGEDRREISTHTETNTSNFTATANADKVGVGVKTTQETKDSYSLTGEARVSTLSAGRDVTRTATNSITDIGTDIEAGRNFSQSATTIQSLAAQNRQITSEEAVKMTETVGVAANYGAGQLYDATRDAVTNYDPTRLQQPNPNVSLDATFNRTTTSSATTDTQAVASNVRAGGTVTSTSTGQTLLQGTNITGGGDVTLKAGDLQIGAARDTHTDAFSKDSIDAAASVTYNGMPGGTLSGGYGTDQSNASASTAVVSNISSGGNLKLDSTGNVRLEGTQLGSTGSTTIAGNNVTFEAAKSTEQSSASGMAASASLSLSKGGGTTSGGASANYSNYSSESASSTSQAGSVNAGTGITIEARTGDLKLEGTNLTAAKDVELTAKQNIDFTAATNTATESSSNLSAGGGFTAGKSSAAGAPSKFGGVNAEYGSGSSNSNSVDKTGGSVTAGGALKLSSGGDTHLEGTQINAASANLKVDGNFNMESAVSTATSSSDSTGVRASVSGGSAIAPKPGAKPVSSLAGTNSAMGSIGLSSSNSNKVTNQNASINVGQLTLNVGGNATLAGADIKATERSGTIQGTTTVEERKDVDVSSSNSTRIRVVAVNKGAPTNKPAAKQPPTRERSNAVTERPTRERSNAVDEGPASGSRTSARSSVDEKSAPAKGEVPAKGGGYSMAEQAKQRANALAQRTETEPSAKGADTVTTRERSNAVTERQPRERSNTITEQSTRERSNAVTERPDGISSTARNSVDEKSALPAPQRLADSRLQQYEGSSRERSNSVTERSTERSNSASGRNSVDEKSAPSQPQRLSPERLQRFEDKVALADTSPAPGGSAPAAKPVPNVPPGRVRSLISKFENDDKGVRVPDDSAIPSGPRQPLPAPAKLGPLDPKIAQAVDGLRNAKTDLEKRKFAKEISDAATKNAGIPERVVLGRYGTTGGYTGEAKAYHGTWFELHPEAWNKLVDGVDPNQQKAIVWPVNRQFLESNLQKGVPRIDFHGAKVEDILSSPDPKVSGSYSAMEIRFLMENAKRYGYEKVGNAWVKTVKRPDNSKK